MLKQPNVIFFPHREAVRYWIIMAVIEKCFIQYIIIFPSVPIGHHIG